MNSDFVRINEKIRMSPVMVIKDDQNIGIMNIEKALYLAKQDGLDLVEISPNAKPPVCKIIDYGKFKYEKKIKERNQKKHSKQLQLKEIRLSSNIEEHDLQVKAASVLRFLEEGHQVQLNLKFDTKRHLNHKELGFDVVKKMIEKVSEKGIVQSPPKMNGRSIVCVLVKK